MKNQLFAPLKKLEDRGTIRIAEERDVPGMLEIYTPIVRNTHTSFEYEVPGSEDFSQRLRHYLNSFPWLVFEEDDKITGYAYAVQVRGRIAYSWSAELSVYVHPDYFGKGIGGKLYDRLIKLLRVQGIRNYYAVIALPNDTSERFHQKLGFEKIAVFEMIGYKKRWIDIAWYLKRDESREPPTARKTMKELLQLEGNQWKPGNF